MDFNRHLELKDSHAFLSPSKITWIRYSDDKLLETWDNYYASQRGVILHKYAEDAINLGIKQAATGQTLNSFINDAISFRMSPEVPLKYSNLCYGTADAISFNEKRQLLRIHDLKTGVTPASMEQLLIYAALFCLEYRYEPEEIKFELRIYQNNEIIKCIPEAVEIRSIMNTIKHECQILEESRGAQ